MGTAGVEAGCGGTTGAAGFLGATIGVTTTPEAVLATGADGAVCVFANPGLGKPDVARGEADAGPGAGAGAGAGLVAAGACAGADAVFSAARIAAREGTNGFAVRARKSRPHFQQKFASSDAIVPH